LQDWLAEFVAGSRASAVILSVLSAHREPLRLASIAKEIRLEQDQRRDGHVLPVGIALIVLTILLGPGLVRVRAYGFAITDAGREVQRRIEAHSAMSTKSHASRARAPIPCAAAWPYFKQFYINAKSIT